MTFYSVVDKNGYVRLSQVTEDENYPIEPGERLLPDNSPDPRRGDYVPGTTKPVRVEPVPDNATEIPYSIVDDIQSSLVEQTGDPEIIFMEEIQL